jgi:cobaltochelatase CobN
VFASAPSEGDGHALSTAIEEAGPADLTEAERQWARHALAASASHEGEALIRALDGRRIAPGPAGAPTRGRLDVLPTGRNLTAIDPRAIPTRTAAGIGKLAAEAVIRRYLQDHGDYPRALIMTLWASASLRTGGDDIAQALHYLGAVPVWDAMSNRVSGTRIMPLAKLGRPRIDVTLRISGLFRDLFETQIALLDLAVRQIAALDEDGADNPLAKARRQGDDLARIFGGAPGSYGAGVAAVALDEPWTARAELGRAALAHVTHSYGGGARGAMPNDGFGARIAASGALLHPQDSAERDVLDGDDVADFTGGMAAAAATLGAAPALYHLDTSRPMAPQARGMDEAIARVVRGRLTNPRWLAGMLEHGHRGVAEIAQAVDALYALAATAAAVPSHLFEAVHHAVIADEAMFAAMSARNPPAAGAVARRLQDALERGMWTGRRNAVADELSSALARAAPFVDAVE